LLLAHDYFPLFNRQVRKVDRKNFLLLFSTFLFFFLDIGGSQRCTLFADAVNVFFISPHLLFPVGAPFNPSLCRSRGRYKISCCPATTITLVFFLFSRAQLFFLSLCSDQPRRSLDGFRPSFMKFPFDLPPGQAASSPGLLASLCPGIGCNLVWTVMPVQPDLPLIIRLAYPSKAPKLLYSADYPPNLEFSNFCWSRIHGLRPHADNQRPLPTRSYHLPGEIDRIPLAFPPFCALSIFLTLTFLPLTPEFYFILLLFYETFCFSNHYMDFSVYNFLTMSHVSRICRFQSFFDKAFRLRGLGAVLTALFSLDGPCDFSR